MRSIIVHGSVLVLVCASFGCSKENTVNMPPEQADAGPDAPVAVIPDCSGAASPALAGRGPEMVRVPSHPGGYCFWMDVTEVTWGQYKAFVADASVNPKLLTECSWNESLEDQACQTTGPLAQAGKLSLADDHPVACVDWCDARTFCHWAGKELCRATDPNNVATASGSSWFAACTNAGTTSVAYGSSPDDKTCNGAANTTNCAGGACGSTAAGSLPGCVTQGDSRIYDLNGNVSEWIGACKAIGATGECYAAGGSFMQQTISCTRQEPLPANTSAGDVGFRCCAYDD